MNVAISRKITETATQKKTVKTQLGELDIKVPRDRNGEYEPKIISKYNRNADGMEEKILSLYACGMSNVTFPNKSKICMM